MPDDRDNDFERLMAQALAREKIRRKKGLKASNRRWFWVAIASGLTQAWSEVADYGGFLGYIVAVQFVVVFAIYTRFLSFPRSFEDEVFFIEWRRPLNLWGEFAREGRLGELITVILVPIAGSLLGYLLH